MACNPILGGWPAVQFDSWRSFSSQVINHVESGSRFVYRGQADSAWDLSPSLLRVVVEGAPVRQILDLEKHCLAEFMAQAHLYIGSEHLPGGRETPFCVVDVDATLRGTNPMGPIPGRALYSRRQIFTNSAYSLAAWCSLEL